jgi:hypothetical protein
MCNKSIICGVLFASEAITFYEGNNMLSALLHYCCSIIGTCKDMPHYDPKGVLCYALHTQIFDPSFVHAITFYEGNNMLSALL